MSITTFLELKNITRRFSVDQPLFSTAPRELTAVRDVSLAIAKGTTLGLVGESGCGKSTLAKIVAHLLPPSSGDILLEGESIWHGSSETIRSLPQRIQMIFQDPVSSLNPRKNIGKSIQEALDVHRIGKSSDRKKTVTDLLERVGMRAEHYARYPHEFSGGQRQRIAIARSLVLNPDFIVCDEPVSALDVSVQAQVLNLLKELQTAFGLTYLFISHDLAVVGHVSDVIAVMYLGRIVELTDAQKLFDNALHPYTQVLLQAVPVPIPGRRHAAKAQNGDLPSPLTPPQGCPFHPRCSKAMQVCKEVTPNWLEVEKDHHVLCHLYS
ncbi:oligopeptide/dipeptide ABC transporter ATP-binding protein [Halodesulfovibrio sp.]|jgi:oligopeptide/dipeptide ABC transporter ATP-binding protein|uniref:ABC transporter ATP-binding protein n=1 Tax=Halodesulfovibrio sp. TaxID=1912772 RepID=UPI0025F430F4|nr:oligopeptide/dipeptide ABC transporter ATP-binding protein [Halodesulfovibrio sp.]MCT4628007.1 ATP-binding cassette domain-containing protein [Halodesulfovibrio sp.]